MFRNNLHARIEHRIRSNLSFHLRLLSCSLPIDRLVSSVILLTFFLLTIHSYLQNYRSTPLRSSPRLSQRGDNFFSVRERRGKRISANCQFIGWSRNERGIILAQRSARLPPPTCSIVIQCVSIDFINTVYLCETTGVVSLNQPVILISFYLRPRFAWNPSGFNFSTVFAIGKNRVYSSYTQVQPGLISFGPGARCRDHPGTRVGPVAASSFTIVEYSTGTNTP